MSYTLSDWYLASTSSWSVLISAKSFFNEASLSCAASFSDSRLSIRAFKAFSSASLDCGKWHQLPA